ncbi:MAG: hypothetical protein AAF242_20060, partial [Bacteroidota bacterium]
FHLFIDLVTTHYAIFLAQVIRFLYLLSSFVQHYFLLVFFVFGLLNLLFKVFLLAGNTKTTMNQLQYVELGDYLVQPVESVEIYTMGAQEFKETYKLLD